MVIEADGAVTVHGQILANGGPGLSMLYAGGGSGGGIQIGCRTIEGNGTLNAIGGAGLNDVNYGGGGGGGRIAVAFNVAAQQAVSPKPLLRFDVSGAKPTANTVVRGSAGTIWLTSPEPFVERMNAQGLLYFAAPVSWTLEDLVVSNGQATVMTELSIAVANDVRVIGGGGLAVSNATGWAGAFSIGNHLVLSNGFLRYHYVLDNPHSFTIGQNLTLTNSGNLYLHAGMTNGGPQAYGGRLNLTSRDLAIPTNCGLYVYSHPEDGGSIRVDAENVRVFGGGRIDTVAGGYRGGSANMPGLGVGGGSTNGGFAGGGGYGGAGGTSTFGGAGPGGSAHGQPGTPLCPGSGGGGVNNTYSQEGPGSAGGGLIWLEVANDLRIDGTLAANGGASARNYAGAGSGGGIQITCTTIRGAGGALQAIGGKEKDVNYGGGGGGGRIAIAYDPDLQPLVDPKPVITMDVSGGSPTANTNVRGKDGTVFLTNPSFFEPIFSVGGRLFFDQTTWSPATLTISNSAVAFEQPMSIHVAGNLDIINNGGLTLTNSAGWNVTLSVGGNLTLNNGTLRYYYPQTNPHAFTVGGNLTMTNTSRLHLHAGPTNTGGAAYGGLLDLSGRNLTIPTNSILYPYVNPTNGGAMCIRAANLAILGGGQINAEALGYAGITNAQGRGEGGGPGGASYGGGGGYGGAGGISYNTGGGVTNGLDYLPLYPGSAGGGAGNGPGGSGGGLVWLEIENAVTVNGIISANGGNNIGAYSGGGSGGGIVIQCNEFTAGGNWTVRAIGGNSNHATLSGRGGGGRIAVLKVNKAYFDRLRDGQITDATVEPPPEELAAFMVVTTGTGLGNAGGSGTVRFVTPKKIFGTVIGFR